MGCLLLKSKGDVELTQSQKKNSLKTDKYVTVPGKRDQFGAFFQNRVIATAGKSRL